jgi:peptidoglycan/LPS O-acetylase OafA/YrhL
VPAPASEKSAVCQNTRLPFWGRVSALEGHASRISFLESIRGLAAAQVLLLHFFTAFVPDLVNQNPSSAIAASIHLSPLYFLYDGYSAVYIFFALSAVGISVRLRSRSGDATEATRSPSMVTKVEAA